MNIMNIDQFGSNFHHKIFWNLFSAIKLFPEFNLSFCV